LYGAPASRMIRSSTVSVTSRSIATGVGGSENDDILQNLCHLQAACRNTLTKLIPRFGAVGITAANPRIHRFRVAGELFDECVPRVSPGWPTCAHRSAHSERNVGASCAIAERFPDRLARGQIHPSPDPWLPKETRRLCRRLTNLLSSLPLSQKRPAV
jgi:hypothetical protein